MYYPRYFKLGQSIQLERVFLDPAQQNQADSLSGQIASCDSSEFIVHFPYSIGESHIAYPFFPGMPFELHSEYHGLGVGVSVTFEERLNPGLVRLVPAGDLGFYYKKEHPRFRTQVWIGCQRENHSLLSMRRQWRRYVGKFREENDPSAVTEFSRRSVELGDDGINMELVAPVETSELVHLFLALDDGKPLICLLAETVWLEAENGEGQQRAGLHFINMLEDDRIRIRRYLRDLV